MGVLLLIAVTLVAVTGVAWQRRAPELPTSLRAIVPGMTIAAIERLVGGALSGDRSCAACSDGRYRMSAHYQVEVPGGLGFGQRRFLHIATNIESKEICTCVWITQVGRVAWLEPGAWTFPLSIPGRA